MRRYCPIQDHKKMSKYPTFLYTGRITDTVQNATKQIEVHRLMFCREWDTHRWASLKSSDGQRNYRPEPPTHIGVEQGSAFVNAAV